MKIIFRMFTAVKRATLFILNLQLDIPAKRFSKFLKIQNLTEINISFSELPGFYNKSKTIT